MTAPQIAIIGAGLSGLACARQLQAADCRVEVLEKSRGAGGRMATRRAADELRFDHGAQYFTCRDPVFASQLDIWRRQGVAQIWNARFALIEGRDQRWEESPPIRYVGTPSMNSICKALAEGLVLRTETRVDHLDRRGDRWELRDERGQSLGSYDWVLSTAPAEQTTDMLADHAAWAARARQVSMGRCWAVMLHLPARLEVDWDGAFVADSPLRWVARNSSKPGRDATRECWVLHAGPEWSLANFERDADSVARELVDELARVADQPRLVPAQVTAHRWKFARVPEPLPEMHLLDESQRLGACGDWCGGPRVEGAWLSGRSLAEAVSAHAVAR